VWAIGVYGGWRALVALVVVIVGFAAIILAMNRWAPGVNAALVLVPVTGALGVLAYLRQDERDRDRPSHDAPGDAE
jgi:hypothetical protein